MGRQRGSEVCTQVHTSVSETGRLWIARLAVHATAVRSVDITLIIIELLQAADWAHQLADESKADERTSSSYYSVRRCQRLKTSSLRIAPACSCMSRAMRSTLPEAEL